MTDVGVTADSAEAVAGAGVTCRALEGDLGWGLGVVLRAYLNASRAAMADVPGGPRGFQVLAASAGDSPDTQLALARQLGIDRTVMTYLLDDLESAGLIERCTDPSDRRVKRVAATTRGEALLDDLHARLRGVEQGLLAPLSGPERESFRAMLARVARGVDAAPASTDQCSLVADVI